MGNSARFDVPYLVCTAATLVQVNFTFVVLPPRLLRENEQDSIGVVIGGYDNNDPVQDLASIFGDHG